MVDYQVIRASVKRVDVQLKMHVEPLNTAMGNTSSLPRSHWQAALTRHEEALLATLRNVLSCSVNGFVITRREAWQSTSGNVKGQVHCTCMPRLEVTTCCTCGLLKDSSKPTCIGYTRNCARCRDWIVLRGRKGEVGRDFQR